jgi:hypothetical protein
VATVLRCADKRRHLGFVHYYQVSDAGQLARSMHGARRKDGFIAVPEKLAKHLYHIAHNNPPGYLQRDSVACRQEHKGSPTAAFVAGFNEQGMPIARQGYMVPCRKHSDCLACGRHPLTGWPKTASNPYPTQGTKCKPAVCADSTTAAKRSTRCTTR